ncbi:MAG: HEPN domain-containing protein [Chloroflexota bacterium]|nr:HEPN domain-containing protein [Chloroflexota bacterium]MDE2959536.1 HEPN domain-containing protein [Chloroflexota bacterium]
MSESLAIAEWQRAEDCRQVARLCLQHGFYADAIARSYYAALHAAKAALALHDVAPRRHRALSNLFGQHIVMTGLIERHWGSVIGELADLRLDADYSVTVIFNEADAADACQQADAFAERIHILLTGIVAPERLQPPTN